MRKNLFLVITFRQLLLALMLCPLSLTAQVSLSLRTITMDDGLPSNTVRNIVQDHYGFMWFGTDNGLCRYDGINVQTYHIQPLGNDQFISSLLAHGEAVYAGTMQGVFCLQLGSMDITRLPLDISTAVNHLTIDNEGQLWVSTMGQGVWRYNLTTKASHHYDIGAVAQIMVDSDNQLWAVSNWSTNPVCRLNRLHDRFETVEFNYSGHYSGLSMLQTHDGRLWLGSWEQGLLNITNNGNIIDASATTPFSCQHIHSLYEWQVDGKGTTATESIICVASDDGLLSYNTKSGQWQQMLQEQSVNARFAYAVTSDHEGGLWIGTFYGGVIYLSPVGRRFDIISDKGGSTGNIIARFCEDHKGHIWIASDDGGLTCYDPHQQFNGYPHSDELSKLNVHALALRDEELWIGTYSDGLYVLNLTTGNLRHYIMTDSKNSLDDFSVYSIFHDSNGNTWVATMRGLNRYNAEDDSFQRIAALGALTIDVAEDSKGRLWLATQGGGLWQYNPTTGKLRQLTHNDKDSHSIADDQVNTVYMDESGRLWVGTASGLCRLDNTNDSNFRRIDLNVPNQNIKGIIEAGGVLWLTTDRGIVRYEPQQEGGSVQRFTHLDGLLSEHFQPAAALKASDGRVYIGSTGGVNMFYPYQIRANSILPPIYITGIQFFNQQQTTGTTIALTEEVSLNYDEARIISLAFASLSYCSPAENQYEYMMDGFDRDWNRTSGANAKATYTNLPSGTYTFRVRATNNDGVWSSDEATLTIVVKPPFWWSWWAKVLYLLIIIGAIWYYIHMKLKRAEQKHLLELQRMNEQKEKENREARLSFFTMVAHEIRTPVSLIIGPLEKLKNTIDDKQLDIIDRNAHRLLELVNQLLDFRKVEQHSLVMHFASHNVNQLLHSISERFEPTFEQGGKQFTTIYPPERFTAIIDSEGITKVISNLLANANKFAKSRVELRCTANADDNQFVIEVSDDGIGIRQEDLTRIFEPFFQSQNKTGINTHHQPGTGIGLSIVKRIVDMHQGTISVQSAVGQWSTFTITLPVFQDIDEKQTKDEGTEQYSDTLPEKPSHQEKPVTADDSALPTMLIVEDNEDMVSFLSSHFQQHYNVLTAGDGIEGMSVVDNNEVNIIVSDWMMPRMDGAEFCRRIRQNPLTSHIPFIMLTARTDNQSKIEGMNIGADIYVEKPFSVEYLEACIANILQMRRLLMQKVSTQPWEDVAQIGTNPVDSELMKRMNQIIEENISNADLNVNFLADKLNISRSGLFAKIKSLSDITPNEMIQVIRLKRAARLLVEGNYLVSEVGYMVGFSSPSYFSKCFYKQFGVKPGDYMKKSK